MKLLVLEQQLPVVLEPDKRLLQSGKTENDPVKAEIKGIYNRIEGKDNNKEKTGKQ